ncbi:MAG: hypothetical protein UU93_C0013G0033 [Candidatus Amesbacteria bacterium GW2011_GWA2_42_12]|uniref:Uncharacterized protein n=1 Tax=Candidatus Amesbacteria bacterium GW2011_GWA2_42_12 TaxID=1618356 RepID=A0A0G1B2X3_9BACT|nr:MAG: hypothetical protein UU93_C0013G0033 [Candidatus Amesbacteria bacterium GW2011_GWA2_42_12]
MTKIDITSESIKNELKNFKDKPANSILEYIWNGFDAGANNINLNYSFSINAGGMSFGYPKFEIIDDGTGWNLDNDFTTKLFLVSQKKNSPYKSLPQGKDGVGRFTFFSFAQSATWESVFGEKKFKLRCSADTLDKYISEKLEEEINLEKGTKVSFDVVSSKLNEVFFEKDLKKVIAEEFCWFIKLYPQKNIYINGEKIAFDGLVYNTENHKLSLLNNDFDLDIVQWRSKPTREYSKYYFLNSSGIESFKRTSGLNNKSDDFYHSVFVRSNFFDNFEYRENCDDVDNGQNILPIFEEKKKVFNELLGNIKDILEKTRKPYLRKISAERISEWKEKHILPKVCDLGINQEDYDSVVKEIFVVAPQLFTNSNDDQRKFILNLISSLLSTEDKNLILKILEQVYKLSDEEKKDLENLLDRTTLSNIIKTIKEIDHRLLVINSLEVILFGDESRYVKEVDHLQKILDENFWIFGDGYRLFSTTEGAIRKTLTGFKDSILRREVEPIVTQSKKELDLFLTKTDITTTITRSIIIEIKRPSVKLDKKEYEQIFEYAETIIKEKSCNGETIFFTFYLVGTDFGEHIQRQIEAMETRGEKQSGLAFVFDRRHNLYIRKWSDIILEQKSRYTFLQEKLNIEMKCLDGKAIDEIVDGTKTN